MSNIVYTRVTARRKYEVFGSPTKLVATEVATGGLEFSLLYTEGTSTDVAVADAEKAANTDI